MWISVMAGNDHYLTEKEVTDQILYLICCSTISFLCLYSSTDWCWWREGLAWKSAVWWGFKHPVNAWGARQMWTCGRNKWRDYCPARPTSLVWRGRPAVETEHTESARRQQFRFFKLTTELLAVSSSVLSECWTRSSLQRLQWLSAGHVWPGAARFWTVSHPVQRSAQEDGEEINV